MKNLERNETLNLLSSLSTLSTKHLQTLYELRRDPCHEYGTCSLAHNKTIWYCYCDSDCEMFNDCCSDYKVTVRDNKWTTIVNYHLNVIPQTYVEGIDVTTGFLAVGSSNSYKTRIVKSK